VASHPLAKTGGVVHYDLDRFTNNLHEMEPPNDDPRASL
jgi:hypothetical protein